MAFKNLFNLWHLQKHVFYAYVKSARCSTVIYVMHFFKNVDLVFHSILNHLMKFSLCVSSQACGKCRGVSYCSAAHQRIDWKKGHKQVSQFEKNL